MTTPWIWRAWSPTTFRLRRELTDPKELIEDVVASLHTQIDDRPVEIHCEPSLPQLPLDRRLLKLALKQVLDNALKYSPPRSPITVRVSNGDDVVNFDITDRGPGIPEQEQGRLFERFYRSPSVKNQVPGFGLGLAIANSIVQAHHGQLTVNSRPGETTFRVTLAVWNRSAQPDRHRSAPMSAGRILVVDDEPQIRRIMRTTLTGAGYEVDDAKTGEEALEKLRDYHPDLVLLDINMPGMGGLAACREIRAGTGVGIIMLTVRNTEADKVRSPGRGRRRLRQQAVQHARTAGSHPRGASAGSSLRAILRRPYSRRQTGHRFRRPHGLQWRPHQPSHP